MLPPRPSLDKDSSSPAKPLTVLFAWPETVIVLRMANKYASLLDTKAADSVRSSHVLLTNSIAAILAAFMTTAINVALPDIQQEFSLGAVSLGWLSLGYMLTLAMFIVTFVRVGDHFGRRLVFLGGLVIYAVSSVIMAFVDSYVPLLAFRLCHGLGASMMFSTSMAMVTLAFPAARRGLAMGVSVAAAYLGMTLGPALGGVMVDFLGWRSLFVLSGSVAVLNLALDLWLLRRAEWKERRVGGSDWVGSLIYAAGLAAFLIGLSLLPLTPGLVLAAAGSPCSCGGSRACRTR
jgi:MFS family permease